MCPEIDKTMVNRNAVPSEPGNAIEIDDGSFTWGFEHKEEKEKKEKQKQRLTKKMSSLFKRKKV